MNKCFCHFEGYEVKDAKARPYKTIGELKSLTNLVDGNIVKTIGYHTPNDGGGATYLIRTRVESDIENNGSIHFIGNNLVAELIVNESVNIKQFGATGDGTTDDTNKLKECFEYASNNKVKCIIPKGVYAISPNIVENVGSLTYTYCFEVKSNFNIEGTSKDSILKIVNAPKSYTSIFCNYKNENYKDISIKNLTIEQDYLSESDKLEPGVNNVKCCIILLSPCENILVDDIYFKNCCGMNPVIISNYDTTNVTLSNCKFDYKYVRGVEHYDRSCVYMECANYKVIGNVVNGNFETLGGIELHGYNGICKDNTIRDCHTAMHISPRFKEPIKSASIWVSENLIIDSVYSIKMWKNTSSQATKGFEGVVISNNRIEIDAKISDQEFFHYDGMVKPTIISGITTELYMDTVYKDLKIINNSINVYNALDYSTVASKYSAGIGLFCPSDMESIVIKNNFIEGTFGSGVSIGSHESNKIMNMTNIEITDNVIKNCGRSSDNNSIHCAYITLLNDKKENVIIRRNIIEKKDTKVVYSAFYNNNSNELSTHKKVYFGKDNIIVRNESETGMALSDYTGVPTVIYEEGVTAKRPTTASRGDIFYDESLLKYIVWNGNKWTNVDGSNLA